MKVPLLDLKAQYATLREELEPVVLKAMADAAYIMGADVGEFEKDVQKYTGARHAVGCANGSDALRLALMAAGIGPGDEVLVPTYTFFATAGAVSLCGATPVFCDIEPEYYNIDVKRLERHVTPNTRAIIPVHLYGQMADMQRVMEFAQKHNLVVIEDGAQAIGATYQGRAMGTIGHMATLSFFPSKNLGCAGDGGMMLTNDDILAERLRILRVHGSKPKYYHQVVGFNSRLDTLQAAILRVKLTHLDKWHAARAKNADKYAELLSDLEKRELVKTPKKPPFTGRHVYNQYVIACKSRDKLKDFLTAAGVSTEVYYPVPLHAQKCFADLKVDQSLFPVADKAAQETLALPIYPELTDAQIEYVAGKLKEFYAS